MIRSILIFAVICLLAVSCKSSNGISVEEATAAITRFDIAWKNKHAKAVDSILAPRYIYFTQSGGVFDRGNLVKTAGSADYTLESMERELVSIAIEGNTAVVNTRWTGKGTYQGQPFNDVQRCSVTLVKLNGEVRILSEHCTPMR